LPFVLIKKLVIPDYNIKFYIFINKIDIIIVVRASSLARLKNNWPARLKNNWPARLKNN
jgi:hypothetical protein